MSVSQSHLSDQRSTEWQTGFVGSGAVTILLTIAAVIVWLSPALTQLLQYDQGRVAAGELWRIATCHWTHWNFDHLFWDASVFLVLGTICERRHRLGYVICLLVSAALVPLSVHLGSQPLTTYRGLSGIDTAVFVLLAVSLLVEQYEQRRWHGFAAIAVLLLGLITKTAFEYAYGQTLFVDNVAAAFTPLPAAHAIGAVIGAAVALVQRMKSFNGKPVTGDGVWARSRSDVITRPHGWEHESSLICTNPRHRQASFSVEVEICREDSCVALLLTAAQRLLWFKRRSSPI